MMIRGKSRRAALVVFVAAVVLLGGGVQAQDAGLLAVWHDGETRKTYSADTNETVTYFAMLPSCEQGHPTLVFSAKYRGKEPDAPPAAVSLRADVGIRTNPMFMRTLTLTFGINAGTKDAATIDVSDSLRTPLVPATPGETIDTAIADVALPDIMRIVEGRALAINVLGMDCSVTSVQLDALRRFVDSVLPRHRG